MNSPCKCWAQCQKLNCRYLHPWNVQVFQGVTWPQQPCPQYNLMTGHWQHGCQWDSDYPYLPNFCPVPHFNEGTPRENLNHQKTFNIFQGGYQPQQANFVSYASETVTEKTPEREVAEMPWSPKKRRHDQFKLGKNSKKQKTQHKSPPNQDLSAQFEKLNLTNPPKSSNPFAEELQVQNDPLYKSLLKFYEGDVDKTLQAFYNLQERFEHEQLTENPDQDAFKRTIIIINFLGLNFFKPQRIQKLIHKFNNMLDKVIERLTKLIHKRKKANQFQIKLARLPSILQQNYESEIPEKCEFLVDGFNVIHKNKHLRNIFFSRNLKDKAEAMIRLRILLETLANGFLVFDKKFLTDNEEQEIFDKIDVKIEQPKLLQTVYANEESTADEKIIEILSGMPNEQQNMVLLVTGDRQLIQLSLAATECRVKLMDGCSFIKACKSRHQVGSRKRIIMRKSS